MYFANISDKKREESFGVTVVSGDINKCTNIFPPLRKCACYITAPFHHNGRSLGSYYGTCTI